MPASPPSLPPSDELLVVRCQLGEREGFEALIHRWQAPVWHYVHRALGASLAAPDVTQEVWLRVIRGIGRLDDPKAFRAWLFVLARRAVMDHLRTKYASVQAIAVDVEDLPEMAADDVSDPSGGVDRDVLDRALAALPITEREVLALFYLKELSLAELAEVVHVPIGTVKSRLHRARRMLRTQLAQAGISS